MLKKEDRNCKLGRAQDNESRLPNGITVQMANNQKQMVLLYGLPFRNANRINQGLSMILLVKRTLALMCLESLLATAQDQAQRPEMCGILLSCVLYAKPAASYCLFPPAMISVAARCPTF